uniref:Uncharacterized protein n=1 Tax=Anguilla anguilla TaxID=7936 RepID=A0A0E9RNW6_ANGAN
MATVSAVLNLVLGGHLNLR